MQTAGGAAFEKDCVCTVIDVQPKAGTSDYVAVNSCRKLSPTGSFLNATGKYRNMIKLSSASQTKYM